MFYLCDLFFMFLLICIVINHMISLKQTYLCLLIFQNISNRFWMIIWTKKVNNIKKVMDNFKRQNVQPQDAPYILLAFCQCQPAVAYKGVSYKRQLLYGPGRPWFAKTEKQRYRLYPHIHTNRKLTSFMLIFFHLFFL